MLFEFRAEGRVGKERRGFAFGNISLEHSKAFFCHLNLLQVSVILEREAILVSANHLVALAYLDYKRTNFARLLGYINLLQDLGPSAHLSKASTCAMRIGRK